MTTTERFSWVVPVSGFAGRLDAYPNFQRHITVVGFPGFIAYAERAPTADERAGYLGPGDPRVVDVLIVVFLGDAGPTIDGVKKPGYKRQFTFLNRNHPDFVADLEREITRRLAGFEEPFRRACAEHGIPLRS